MLSAKMQQALDALLVSNTRKAAAEKAGIDAKTLGDILRKKNS